MRRARQLRNGALGRALGALCIGALLLAQGAPALAQDKDADGLVAVADALSDYTANKHADALKKLEDALKLCAGSACLGTTRAQIQITIGIVQGAGLKQSAKAFAAFQAALKEDPKAIPDKQFMNKELNKLWNEAKAAMKKGTTGGPTATRPAPTRAQLEAVNAAKEQLAQKNWSDCMGLIIAGMAENEFAAGKLVLAQCEDMGGLVLEATGDAKLASKYAEEELNNDVKKKADDLLARLANDTPTIVVAVPRTVDDPEVIVDGVSVPKDKADKPIPHNPGKATIEVKGKKGQFPFNFKSTETFDRGEKVTVNVADDTKGNSAVFQCIQAARTAADVSLCIETGGKGRGLTIRGGMEVASYNDSTNVDVLSPTLFISAENPTAGWRVGGSYTVDVVSNASPDIVATATRRFDEVRNAGSLAAEVKLGPARVGIDGAVSVEPDYIGRGVGANVSADIVNKTVTPTLAYHLGFDILGKGHTPFYVFHRNIMTHDIDLGVSLVVNATTIAVVGGTIEIQDGDTSKPYRHIPMFTDGISQQIPRGATPLLVGTYRLPLMPFEQLPDNRKRFALMGRLSHRFENATVRGDERIYTDTWGLKASTTDARFFYDATKSLRVGPHLRFHIQGPVDFWKRAYVAEQTPTGEWSLPKYRTGDRELGPLFGVTLGAGVRYKLTDIFAVSVQAEGIYTQFLDHIYVYDRWGFFSATTLEIGLE
ncbi:MAG: DUF3570 domain-containing protein [Byssovorax sp.]